MKLYSEEQILDVNIRKLIIEDIDSSANTSRRTESLKRQEVYKDNVIKYVLMKLQNEISDPETVRIMSNRATNISIMKKIVNKLSKVYAAGCTREAITNKKVNQDLSQSVSYLALLLDFDARQKKADRYSRFQKNCLPWFMPERVYAEDGTEKYVIKMKVFSPWQYDAIENAKDPDCPLGIVLSDFSGSAGSGVMSGPNQVNSTDAVRGVTYPNSALIAQGSNAYTTDKNKHYVFWTNKYHLTCNAKGEIITAITPEDYLNPIGVLPGYPMGIERDENFWATGGEDLTDGSILINTILTDMLGIQFIQGWGQLVITGPKGVVSRTMKGGPHHALIFEYDSQKGQDKPTVDMVSTEVNIAGWLQGVESLVAFILSTNNLAPSAVANKLDATNVASGIAMLIERSESTEDIKDRQGDFARAERREWQIYAKWHNRLLESGVLDDEFALVGALPEDMEVAVRFNQDPEVISESERLDNMQKKKDLGIVRQIELIMQDNPGISEEQAQAKLSEIMKERAAAIVREQTNLINGDTTKEDGNGSGNGD